MTTINNNQNSEIKLLRFYELDGEQKDTAVDQMFTLSDKRFEWENKDDVRADLEQDFNPDEYFYFFQDADGRIETEIK